jgi:hypothetical protein
MMAFSTNGTSRSVNTGKVRIEKIEKHSSGSSDKQSRTKEIWARAKSFAHNQLWFDYVLPGLLQSEGVDTTDMMTGDLAREIGQIWETKSYETQPQIAVVMTFTHEDYLLEGYDGDMPTRYDKDTSSRIDVKLNALASIGSNEFRWWVMEGDDWSDAQVIPNECFFGTYPIKERGEIVKGKFRCIIKLKR